jgi:hypothetical protein
VNGDENLAWLAGFLEGEGSFGCYANSKGPLFIQIACQTTDEDVAQRVAGYLGVSANGPYTRKGRNDRKPYFCINLSGYGAPGMMLRLHSHMGQRRQQEIAAALDRWNARPKKIREMRLPPTCHPERKHYSRGLCSRCHYKAFHHEIGKLSVAEIESRLSQAAQPQI